MSLTLSTRTARWIAAVLLSVLTAGVTASCTEGGTYQGGGDSVPHYRR